jgi:hypothetical protein
LTHPRPIQRHIQSAFSFGTGFEDEPPGRFFDPEAVRGYFLDFRAKTTSVDAHLPETWDPAPLAQLGLGWFERTLAGDDRATEPLRHICTLFQDRVERRDAEAAWPYLSPLRKYRVDAPWYSAMAQGQIASLLTRVYLSTADPAWAELARGACVPLLSPDHARLVTITPDGPILEEIPSEPGSHVLNGWIFALWGLWDASQGLGDSQAGAMFARSLDCLRRTLDGYDVGWWTRYSLYPHVIVDLAKPFYHKLHIDQVELLYRISGYVEFRDAARRWRAYDKRARRLGVVAHKTFFVATKHI